MQEVETSFQSLQFSDPLDFLKKNISVLRKFWGKEESLKMPPASPSVGDISPEPGYSTHQKRRT